MRTVAAAVIVARACAGRRVGEGGTAMSRPLLKTDVVPQPLIATTAGPRRPFRMLPVSDKPPVRDRSVRWRRWGVPLPVSLAVHLAVLAVCSLFVVRIAHDQPVETVLVSTTTHDELV